MALSGSQITRIAVGGPGLSYSGFVAKSASDITISPGLEYTLISDLLHYTQDESLLHYTQDENLLHYTFEDED